jgi:hypothetical protein
MNNPVNIAKSKELILADALSEVSGRAEQVEGILVAIATNDELDLDIDFRNALWGALSILRSAKEIKESAFAARKTES